MVVAFVAVAVFSKLPERLRRQQLTLAFCGFFLAVYAGRRFSQLTADNK